MLDLLKKTLSGQALRRPAADVDALRPIEAWAATLGWDFSAGTAPGFTLKGDLRGRPWRMELVPSSRAYIAGHELKGRCDLGISDLPAVMVIDRTLKERLEKSAYSMYTDGVQTMAAPSLPEEMRWLAMYEEVGWDSLPRPFWKRYAVVASRRQDAADWIGAALADELLGLPPPSRSAPLPLVLTLTRGKLSLRMQGRAGDADLVERAADAFLCACSCALKAPAFKAKSPAT